MNLSPLNVSLCDQWNSENVNYGKLKNINSEKTPHIAYNGSHLGIPELSIDVSRSVWASWILYYFVLR